MSDRYILDKTKIEYLLDNNFHDYESLEKEYINLISKTNNELEKEIMGKILDKSRFTKTIPIDKFCVYLNILNDKILTDNQDIVLELLEQTDDQTQINILKSCIKNYPKKNNYNNKTNIISKKCPHCDRINKYPEDTQYVICGYVDNEPFNWFGCGRDWCFTCGKKLCKKWGIDELYLKINRLHDKKCCKKHAKINSFDYKSDYCFCYNFFVSR
jgi:hypothetical protein